MTDHNDHDDARNDHFGADDDLDDGYACECCGRVVESDDGIACDECAAMIDEHEVCRLHGRRV